MSHNTSISKDPEKRYYAGVGSRKTPEDILTYFRFCGGRLKELGYTLRSGAAIGADSAFEELAWPEAEIFVAKKGTKYLYENLTPLSPAYRLAEELHPAWRACTEYARQLHARNCFQVLGRDLETPVRFLLCWTPCGSETAGQCNISTGGTATAIRLAHRHSIPIFNFANEGRKAEFKKFIHEQPPW